MKCSCADFIGTLFLARDVAHSVHLNTRSFSKHTALNIFYDRLLDATDDFSETYQGRHGLIGPITLMSAKKTTNIIEFLDESLADVERMRYEFIKETDTPLQNLIDAIVEVYLRTLYKLKFLA